MKEAAIRDYLSKIDFKGSNWDVYAIQTEMRKFLGEEPAIDIVYKKDVMINEINGEAKEVMEVNRVKIIFTDTDDKIKKLEFII